MHKHITLHKFLVQAEQFAAGRAHIRSHCHCPCNKQEPVQVSAGATGTSVIPVFVVCGAAIVAVYLGGE